MDYTIKITQPAYNQLRQSISQLINKKNYPKQKQDVDKLVKELGTLGEKCMMELIFESLEIQSKDRLSSSFKLRYLLDYLSELVQQKNGDSHILDYLGEILEQISIQNKMSASVYLQNLFQNFKSGSQQFALNLQLIFIISLTTSLREETRKESLALLRQKLKENYELQRSQPNSQYQTSFLVRLAELLATGGQEFQLLQNEIQYIFKSQNPPFNVSDKGIIALNTILPNPPSIGQNHLFTPKGIFKDLGPQVTFSMENLNTNFQDINFKIEDVLDCLVYFSNHPEAQDDSNQRLINQSYLANKTNKFEEYNKLNENLSNEVLMIKWDHKNLIQFFNQKIPNLQWDQVMLALDRENLDLNSHQSLLNLFEFFNQAKQVRNFKFPQNLFFGNWVNKKSQVRFLILIFESESIDFLGWNDLEKRVFLMEWNPTFRPSQLENKLQLWASFEFLELLINLSAQVSDQYVEIRNLFEQPIQKCPDILLIGLVGIKPTEGGELLDELFSQLFPIYLQNQTNSLQIIEYIWKTNPNLLYTTLSQLYKKENKRESTTLNLSRVLDITQQLGCLMNMVNGNDYQFSVALGILAGKREFLHFDNWFQERVTQVGGEFIEEVLNYVDEVVICQIKQINLEYNQGKMIGTQYGQLQNQYEKILEKGQLNVELLALILESLLSHKGRLSQQLQIRFEEIYKRICEFFPALMKASGSEDHEKTEKSANNLFEKIYKQKIGLQETVETLRKYKKGESKEDKEVFACMITCLLEEQKFHGKYPDLAINLTAQLFGSILNADLLEGKPLQILLNIISEYVKKTKEDKFLRFALTSMKLMKQKLLQDDYQKLCKDFFQNQENIAEVDEEFLEEVYLFLDAQNSRSDLPKDTLKLVQKKKLEKDKLKMQNPIKVAGNSPSTTQILDKFQTHPRTPSPDQVSHQSNQTHARAQTSIPSEVQFKQNLSEPLPNSQNQFYARMSISQIVKYEEENYKIEIEENLKKEVQFIFNNLDQNNIGIHVTNIQKHLTHNQKFLPWLSKYLLFKRGVQDSNQHPIYVDLILKTKGRTLYKKVTRDTYLLVHKMILSEKQAHTTDDKKISKNIGNWIGQLTINQNRPINFKYLNLKQLLTNTAYVHSLQTIIIIICKIFDYTKNSLIFKTSNHWVQSILQILYDISSKNNKESQIQTQIKYTVLIQIDVLFKSLDIIAKDHFPISTNHTNTHYNPQILAQSNTNLNQIGNNLANNNNHNLNQENLNQENNFNNRNNNPDNLIIPELPTYVIYDNANLDKFDSNYINLKLAIAKSIDKAIQDIIPPVISRSVTIALITTKEIALKDFAYETDNTKMLKGVHWMVQKLSGSLALVTCREPLKISFGNHLKAQLEQINEENKKFNELLKKQPDYARIQNQIRKILSEQDIQTIGQVAVQDNIDLGCSLIKKAVQEKALEDINNDDSIQKNIQDITNNHPEQRSHIHEIEQNISTLPEELKPKRTGLSDQEFAIYDAFSMKPAQNQENKNQEDLKLADYRNKYKERISRMLLQIEQNIQDETLLLPLDKAIQDLSLNSKYYFYDFVELAIPIIINTQIQKHENFIKLVNKYSQGESAGKLLSVEFQQMIKAQLNYQNSKNFDKLPTVLKSLLLNKILDLTTFYQISDDLIKSNNQNAIYCLVQFLGLIISDPNQFSFLPQQFTKLLADIGNTSIRNNPDFNLIKEKFTLKPIKPARNEPTELEKIIIQVNQSFQQYETSYAQNIKVRLERWLNIIQEKQISDFILDIQQVFFNPAQEEQIPGEYFSKFFIYFTDLCVKHALQSNRFSGDLNSFENLDLSYIDQFSKLLTIILKTETNQDKCEYLDKICDAIVIVLAKYHDNINSEGIVFDQRPFFKLILNLIYDIKRPEYSFQEQEVQGMFLQLTKMFHKLEPMNFPGFSFVWLELISNRYYLPSILNNKDNWMAYHTLIVQLLRFFKYIANQETIQQEYMKIFYKGLLRVLLVFLHDYNDFLSEYAYVFVEEIPSHLIQIRNIILSAYPKEIHQDDPFTLQHIDDVQEFKKPPKYFYPNLDKEIQNYNFEKDFQNFIYDSDLNLNGIKNTLMKCDAADVDKNSSCINILTLAIPYFLFTKLSSGKTPEQIKSLREKCQQFFQVLIKNANLKLRDAILNHIMNNIRYPNQYTHFYVTFILRQFNEDNKIENNEDIQEQITRIFVERLITEPHPWGIMLTFVELSRNEKYNFKKRPYFQNKEIKDIFQFVFKHIDNQ